ncbi:MAG: hypothetical protein WD689_01250 [Gaiellaceae bacterium]
MSEIGAREGRTEHSGYDLAVEKGYLEELPAVTPAGAMMHKAAQAVGLEGR